MYKKKYLLLFLLIFTITCLFFLGCENNQAPNPPVTVKVNYIAAEGGYIMGISSQTVQYGGDTAYVVATPSTGYKFVKWDDGYTEARREDNNIKEDLTVTAIFEKISFLVTYQAGDGGYIEGEKSQTIKYYESTSTVTAIPNEGYQFVRWSDNTITAQRKDESITDNMTVTAIFKKLSCTVNYYAAEGGFIDGEVTQTGLYGDYTLTVTAVANKDFRFIGWDDGCMDAQRTDRIDSESQSYTALFERIGKTFTYVYNNATENTEASNIVLYYDSLYAAKFPTPQRINSTFEGWYLEKDFKTQVTDSKGKLLLDAKIFDNESDNLYAKFNIIEKVTYKILMVYVTEVKGTFLAYTGENISIHHKMSDIELQMCSLITKLFAHTLNEAFAGLVNFEVDEYFTQEHINETAFVRGYSNAHGWGDYSLQANNIPEISKDTLNKYRSVMTTVQLGNPSMNPQLHTSGGNAGSKYACLYWDPLHSEYSRNGSTVLEWLSDYEHGQSILAMDLYLHEFAHTVEIGLPNAKVGLHDLEPYLPDKYMRQSEEAILYLLNQIEDKNSEKIGIPYEFWKDEIYINVEFVADEGGHIDGTLNQKIKLGGYAQTVVAIPDFGYKFIGWSNGDKNAELIYGGNSAYYSDKVITALFEEIKVAVNYVCLIDDKFVSEWKMEIFIQKDFLSSTLYIPKVEFYEFKGWFLDKNLTQPIGDEYGNVTEADYIIFDKGQVENAVTLYGKFHKIE